MPLSIDAWPLPYEERLASRPSSAIDLVVIHCTELPDMAMAREFGERIHYAGTQTGNSGHYYVDRDGKIFRFVADTRVANHTYGYNPRSIGIELVNIGRYPHWGDSRYQAFTMPYTAEQITALRALLAQLRNDHPTLRWIAGHEDLDRRLEPAKDDPTIMLRRRQDPGPLFPWDEVMADSGLERLSPP
jgi:N-acetylmuramoyl-L-alanine amidase